MKCSMCGKEAVKQSGYDYWCEKHADMCDLAIVLVNRIFAFPAVTPLEKTKDIEQGD